MENRFLKSLPKRMTTEEVSQLLAKTPDFSNSQELNDLERMNLLTQLITGFRIPFPIHSRIYEKIYETLLMSYQVRSEENLASNIDDIDEWKENKDRPHWSPRKQSPIIVPGASLNGISGMGKSTAMRDILSLFPQLIKHENPYRIQITYVVLTCPSNASTKALCKQFFMEIDRIIGGLEIPQNRRSSYHKLYESYSEDDLMTAMSKISEIFCIGMIVFDELQGLKATKKGGNLLNFFTVLNTIVGVPFFFIGTPEAIEVISTNLATARRIRGSGRITWVNMQNKINPPEMHPSQWQEFMNALWKLQVLKDPGELTDDIRNAYYFHSQGITEFTVMLHKLAQKTAIELGSGLGIEKITVDIINFVAPEAIGDAVPMMAAIRSGDYGLQKQFADVYMSGTESSAVSTPARAENNRNTETDSPTTKDIGTLTKMVSLKGKKIPKELVENFTKEILKNYPETEFAEKVKILEASIDAHLATLKEKKKAPEGKLIEIYRQAKNQGKSVYESLKEAGYIGDLNLLAPL